METQRHKRRATKTFASAPFVPLCLCVSVFSRSHDGRHRGAICDLLVRLEHPIDGNNCRRERLCIELTAFQHPDEPRNVPHRTCAAGLPAMMSYAANRE